MADYNLFYPILVENEGGWANVQGDNGGQTYRGISRNYFPNWLGWKIIDSYKNNQAFPHILNSDDSLQSLVKSFYKPTFWDAVLGDEINNQSIANFIADFGVNSGTSVPIKHLQAILNVGVDGKMGPQTLQAINSADGEVLFNSLKEARIQFYHAVVFAHPQDQKFLNTWLQRTNSFSYKS